MRERGKEVTEKKKIGEKEEEKSLYGGKEKKYKTHIMEFSGLGMCV